MNRPSFVPHSIGERALAESRWAVESVGEPTAVTWISMTRERRCVRAWLVSIRVRRFALQFIPAIVAAGAWTAAFAARIAAGAGGALSVRVVPATGSIGPLAFFARFPTVNFVLGLVPIAGVITMRSYRG